MTTKRSLILASLRVAGYHNDTKTWTRTYVENRVSIQVAKQQWHTGQDMRSKGVPCSCSECAVKK